MKVQISKLPCGLRVVTDRMDTVETVSLGVWVGAGSRNETESNNGVAHFLEHMAFKGTESRSALQIAEEIESVGGYLNAYTSREVTAYYARVLKQDTKLAMDILADILQHSTFEAQEMEREREVILQEIGQSHDTPDDIIFDHFQSVCYPGQSLGRPILGPAEGVKSMSRDVLIQFMDDHYAPENMVLVASGNVTHEQVVDWANSLFQLAPKKAAQELPAAEFLGGESWHKKELEQLHLLMGFEGPGATHPDYYAGTVFSTVFGGGMSSRLFQEVREKRGLVYSVYSFLTAQQDTGTLGVYAGTSEKDAAELVQVVADEFQKMTHTILDTEIRRAKTQMKASMLMGLESSSGRARRIAHTLLTFGEYIPIEDVIQKIERVTLDEVQAFAGTLLSKPFSMAALGPTTSLPSFAEVKDRFEKKDVT